MIGQSIVIFMNIELNTEKKMSKRRLINLFFLQILNITSDLTELKKNQSHFANNFTIKFKKLK